MRDMDVVINRHMARLLSELEEAGCPAIFRDAVKSKLQWLRSDIMKEMNEGDRNGSETNTERH
jgi:hypothetical protein